MVKKVLTGLAGMALAAGLTVMAAPSASAAAQGAYGCAGSQIGSHNIKDSDGSVWGTIYVYYSSANGGTNCVVNVSKKYVGQVHTIEVHLSVGSVGKSDAGKYTEYAGPVSISGTDGKCLNVSGEVDTPSGSKSVAAGWSDVHCG